MKKQLNDILSELKKTTFIGVKDFVIENGNGKFKYLDCEFFIKKSISKTIESINGTLTLYQNTQLSYPPNSPILEEIKDFELKVTQNGKMLIKNYLDFSNFSFLAPTLYEGEMALTFDDVSTMYFKQLDEKISQEQIKLWITE
jgi:hypothetical protein